MYWTYGTVITFFERKLQIVRNFHGLELVPQVGSTKIWKMQKRPLTVI